MRIFIFIVGFLFTTITFAQVDIKCISLTDPDLRFFYAEIENELKIIGIKIDTTVELTSKVGAVHHYSVKDKSEYILKYKNAIVDTIRIFKDGKVIFEDRFEVHQLPIPKVKLGNIEGRTASIDEILNDPEIRIVLEDCKWVKKCTFKTFDLILLDKAGNIINRYDDVSGNKLTKQQQKVIKEMKTGDTVILKNLLAYIPGSESRSIRPLSITIK